MLKRSVSDSWWRIDAIAVFICNNNTDNQLTVFTVRILKMLLNRLVGQTTNRRSAQISMYSDYSVSVDGVKEHTDLYVKYMSEDFRVKNRLRQIFKQLNKFTDNAITLMKPATTCKPVLSLKTTIIPTIIT